MNNNNEELYKKVINDDLLKIIKNFGEIEDFTISTNNDGQRYFIEFICIQFNIKNKELYKNFIKEAFEFINKGNIYEIEVGGLCLTETGIKQLNKYPKFYADIYKSKKELDKIFNNKEEPKNKRGRL